MSKNLIPIMSATESVINHYHKRFDYYERITPDGKSVFVSIKTGEMFTKRELDEIYPTPTKLYEIPNCDRRKAWMDNDVSY